MQRFLAFVLAVLMGAPAFADSPVIWNGPYARNLTSKGFLLSNGAQLNNDGPVNYAPQRAIKWTVASNVTVADDTTAADLARANTTGNGVKFAATGAGNAFFCFTLDTADYNKKLSLTFDQNTTAGAASYTANQFQVDVYSSTSSTCASGTTRLALSTDSSAVSGIPALSGTYRTTFDSPGSAAQYVKVQITQASGSPTIILSNFYVGPGVVTQGAAVTGWTSYTPTLGGTATCVVTSAGQYRRVGESMQVRIYSTFATGNCTGSSTVLWPLPTGYTINTAALPNQTTASNNIRNILGTLELFDSSTGGLALVEVLTADSTDVQAIKTGSTSTYISSDISTTKTAVIDFTVPINEWAGNGTVNISNNSPSFVATSDTWDSSGSTTIYGPTGQAIGGALTTIRVKTVTLPGPPQAGDLVQVEIDPAGTGQWQPAVGTMSATSNAAISTLTYTTTGVGTNSVGVAWHRTGATTYAVLFGRYYAATLDGSSVLYDWSDFSAVSGRWRLAWYNGNQAVGFGQVTQTGAGLVTSAGQLLGTNTNDTANAGNVGEFFERSVSSNVSLSTNTINDVDSTGITLTPGTWDIRGVISFLPATTTSITLLQSWPGTATGNVTTGKDNNRNLTQFSTAATVPGNNLLNFALPVYRVTLSATTTYYLKANAVFTVSTMTANGTISATRVR